MTADVAISNYLPLSHLYTARYGEGRVSLPVMRSQAMFANFAHVSGVPATSGAAYSVDKLHMLEILIARLERVKTDPLAAREASPSLDSERVDALIQQYSGEMHALATAKANPYARAPQVEAGMLFSLAA